MSTRESREGLLYGVVAYGLWGFFPVYWKQLLDVPAIQILAYRMVLSLVFVIGLLLLLRRTAWIKAAARDGKTIAQYFLTALFLAVNWGVYIWAVNSGYVVETSLGYFINPLINVVFGALFLAERPRKGQWFSIAFAACGVLFLTTQYGQPPWIALTLAVTFGIYGLIKKTAKLDSLEGLSLETALLFLPALAFLGYCHANGEGALGQVSTWQTVLLLGSGVVTATPLIFFAAALRRLTLMTAGILQYIAPTIQFLLGVFLYQEPFGTERFIGFLFIWVGLAMFTAESIWFTRLRRRRSAQESRESAPAKDAAMATRE